MTSSFLWFAPDVLGVPRDPVGRRHRRDRRRLQHLLRGVRPVLRHLRRPPPQARRRWCSPPRCRRPASPWRRSSSSPSTAGDLLRLRSPWFWVLVMATLLGSVAGQMRGIALSTCVTLLVPEDRRDRANGKVGTVTGLSFAITSVFSGLVIGQLGMGWAYYGSLALTIGALVAPAHHPHRRAGAGAAPGGRGATEPRRHPRRARGHPRGARSDDADPAGRLQQPARRGVHGAARRLRAHAGLGRDLGVPVRLHQPGLHRRWALRGPLRARPQPAAGDHRRQRRELAGVLVVRGAVVHRDADHRDGRVARR